MNQPLGQYAYEATQQYLASNLKDPALMREREELEEWAELPPIYREAWEAGAQAVCKANHAIDRT
jgi:hypothetical protein